MLTTAALSCLLLSGALVTWAAECFELFGILVAYLARKHVTAVVDLQPPFLVAPRASEPGELNDLAAAALPLLRL
jgi:hypothetical protein